MIVCMSAWFQFAEAFRHTRKRERERETGARSHKVSRKKEQQDPNTYVDREDLSGNMFQFPANPSERYESWLRLFFGRTRKGRWLFSESSAWLENEKRLMAC